MKKKKLTGLAIQKLLPKTNCKECGSNTCMAFAMKLAAKKVNLSLCPYVSEEAKKIIGAASEPPVKSIRLGAHQELKLGEETVLYRHEKKFVNRTAIAININDTDSTESVNTILRSIQEYCLERAGQVIKIDMISVSNIDSDSTGTKFLSMIQKVWEITHLPLVLKSQNPDLLAKAAEIVTGSHSIIASATLESMNYLKSVAKKYGHSLVLEESDLNKLVEMSSALKKEGFTNIILNFQPQTISESFMINTIIRRAAITNEVKDLGYPTLNFIQTNSPIENLLMTLTEIAKYGGVCVLPTFDKAQLITLLTLRMGIYTDPQKPIQVEPKIYPIGEPTKDSLVFVTTNFSLTFFIVSGEIENSGINAWLIIPECEGMSVLTAWAAGKFNAGTISKFIKEINLEEQINTREIIIPGYVAQISGELDELLPNWTIRVGPNDASDIESYIMSLKNLKN